MFRLQARKVCITPPRPGFPQVASVPAWLYAALPGDDGEHDDAHFLPWTGPLGQLVSLLVPQLNKTLPLLTALPPADLGLRISWALRTGRQSALQPRWIPTPQASRLYLREMFVKGYTGGVIPNGRLHAGDAMTQVRIPSQRNRGACLLGQMVISFPIHTRNIASLQYELESTVL